MQLSNNQFYVYYSDYEHLINEMEGKILQALEKSPNRDFSEAWEKVDTLKHLQLVYHNMYHFQQSIDNESGKIMKERDFLLKKLIRLEEENNQLKQNLNL